MACYCLLKCNIARYHVILESDRVDYGGPARIDPHGTFFTHPTPYCGLPQSLEVWRIV